MTGSGPGVTSKVDITARWSDGHGSTAKVTSGPPCSPASWAAVAFAGPAE